MADIEWLDIDLLVALANKMPHWDFVFIGEHCDLSALKALNNVYFLGEKSA